MLQLGLSICKQIIRKPQLYQFKFNKQYFGFCSIDKNILMQNVIEQKLKENENKIVSEMTDNHISFTLNNEIKGSIHGDSFYVIMFTCGVCDNKLSRKFTKKAYHEGVVIIRCDSCDNNHLISDNLGWFDDNPINIEQIMAQQGKKHLVYQVSDPNLNNIINSFMNNEQQQQQMEKRAQQQQEQLSSIPYLLNSNDQNNLQN